MSLHDLLLCRCGHARHWHARQDTKQGVAWVHCKRCACEAFVPDLSSAVSKLVSADEKATNEPSA